MFIKSYLAKFEWKESELPNNITGSMLENLILTSTTENFVVCDEGNGEIFFTNNFDVLSRDVKYGTPDRIQTRYYNGTQKNFDKNKYVLFKVWKNDETPSFAFINFYSRMIMDINKVLKQHVKASTLIAHVTAKTAEEKAILDKVFEKFDGVKISIIKNTTSEKFDLDAKKLDITQFEIQAKFSELETLKHELEKDLFLRLGIEQPDNKTHVAKEDVMNSEIIVDLINTYELKLRKNFCKRFNILFNKKLTVSLHKSINPTEQGGENDNNK